MKTFGARRSPGFSWLILSAAAFIAAWPCCAKDVVVHAGTLLDGISDNPRHQVSITVRDDRILSVDSGFLAPPGADIIDLSTATVMPGFIDCHVHISALLPTRTNATEYWLTHTDIDRAFDAAVFVREMLQQGFTGARDLGGGDETVAVRNAIDGGKIPGPRLWVSLEALGPTGGHADRTSAAARDHPELLTPGTAQKELDNDLLPKRNLLLAVKSGVKIAYGTDLGQGDHTMEFALLIGNGMAPIQALYAATRNAAELLGAATQVGSVQSGRYADLVATTRNPLDDPAQWAHVTFVMKGGIVYRRDGAPTAARVN